MVDATNAVPRIELNDGTQIPQLGFGVYQIDPAETEQAVSTALEAGYRHVDTAAAYRNERQVGESVRASDEQVYVTTKYMNPTEDHGYEDAKGAFQRSIDRLGLDHVDLYLIHFPIGAGEGYTASWRALTELRNTDGLRSIGVSNFTSTHLARAIDETGVTPAVNQVELHPYFQQAELRRDHAQRGIATEAWGPLGQGAVLEDPVLTEIAEAHGKTVAQVVIRWHLQLGTIVIPKSVTASRIRANFDVFDFELTTEQMRSIETLDRADGRNGPDPNTFVFPKEPMPET
ncbi:2,5-diketo-D-gluconate reductase A [Saccharopolyspora lacisalsi]|uniref:2,5-diketo-D-gluconate reductase A n=1 Tax=Halosaccharopolyspora lacisalsi TaxID=1000566 RepID=A0A839DSA8_9PSEU|nr:aldo/keto reductase [Halosaccharopolyspora lacisalsi]MBA8823963.1 2,5-diketo-D-gluconate reductase A [Halosaccharopolyspora lacisalsi]